MKVFMALGTFVAFQQGFSNKDLIILAMSLTRFLLTLSSVIVIFCMVAIISPMHVTSESLKVDSLRV
jgi:predicted anti-sigma-YlaC factor YlaD